MEVLALTITAAASVGGTLLGAVVGLRGARSIGREERTEAAHGETVRAFAEYVSALVPIVAELRELPAVPSSSPLESVVNQLRGEAATYFATRRREQELFGGRNREQAARLAAAAVDLRLRPLPQGVRDAIDRANNYVERLGQDRSDEMIAAWPAIHSDLMDAGAELRDSQPRSARVRRWRSRPTDAPRS